MLRDPRARIRAALRRWAGRRAVPALERLVARAVHSEVDRAVQEIREAEHRARRDLLAAGEREAALSSARFAEEVMSRGRWFPEPHDTLVYALAQAPNGGMALEFGVCDRPRRCGSSPRSARAGRCTASTPSRGSPRTTGRTSPRGRVRRRPAARRWRAPSSSSAGSTTRCPSSSPSTRARSISCTSTATSTPRRSPCSTSSGRGWLPGSVRHVRRVLQLRRAGRQHEFRAWQEWLERHRAEGRVPEATPSIHEQVVVRIVEPGPGLAGAETAAVTPGRLAPGTSPAEASACSLTAPQCDDPLRRASRTARAGRTLERHDRQHRHPRTDRRRLQGRRPLPGRLRPQGDPPRRARDARPDGPARGVRRRAAARRRPHRRLAAHDRADRRPHRDADRARRRRPLGQLQHLLHPGPRRRGDRRRRRHPRAARRRPGVRLEGRDAGGVLVVHPAAVRVPRRERRGRRPEHAARRRRRRHPAGAPGHPLRGRRRRARRPRRLLRRVQGHPRRAARQPRRGPASAGPASARASRASPRRRRPASCGCTSSPARAGCSSRRSTSTTR